MNGDTSKLWLSKIKLTWNYYIMAVMIIQDFYMCATD